MEGEKVWLKIKHFKTGENRKLSPRRDGPLIVLRKMPNGVNFEINNENTSETKIVHHDRLSPIRNKRKKSNPSNGNNNSNENSAERRIK